MVGEQRRRCFGATLLLTTGFGLWLAAAAHAATVTVTNFGDDNSAGQLRTLINAAVAGDTIVVGVGTIGLDFNLGPLLILVDLTIEGAGAAKTIIDATNNAGFVLALPGLSVQISGVTVRNGSIGVFNIGMLTVTDSALLNNFQGVFSLGPCVIRRSTLSRNANAAVINQNTLTISDSVVSSNTDIGIIVAPGSQCAISNTTVSGNGSGLLNVAQTAIANSTFSHNTAGMGTSGVGGAIVNLELLALTNSTLSGNSADIGGGLFNDGVVSLNNVTITNNTATATGLPLIFPGGLQVSPDTTPLGGVVAQLDGALAAIANATSDAAILSAVTAKINDAKANLNLASDEMNDALTTIANANIHSGGGIVTFSGVTVQNTIIAGNTDLDQVSPTPDCSSPPATISSGGFNLVGKADGCNWPPAISGDQIGTIAKPINPQLGALANNGGPTFTHALSVGGPAVDKGNPTGCTDALGVLLGADQRDARRPRDGDGDGVSICDIGAYELQPTLGQVPTLSTFLIGVLVMILTAVGIRRLSVPRL